MVSLRAGAAGASARASGIRVRDHRGALLQWFETQRVQPSIVAELDDSALMKAFGQAGAGLFIAPTAIVDHVCEQYKVVELGRIESVVEQVYAITTERRITHPAIVAISKVAREDVFGIVKS